MKLRPLRDNILVRPEKADSITSGGLFIPSQAQKKTTMGEVLAIGPGRYLDNGTLRPVGVEPGQVVYFQVHTGQEVRIDGEDLILLREEFVDGIVSR